MGLLSLGTPLSWDETKPLADHVRDHGITQFLHTWARWKDVKEGKGFLWGDEVRSSSNTGDSGRLGELIKPYCSDNSSVS
jgi:hypothetical protein